MPVRSQHMSSMAATQPPLPPPPPLPPLPLDVVLNTELPLVPPDDSKQSLALTSMLTSFAHPAVVVGVIGDSPSAVTHFANRLLGRQAFTTVEGPSINIRMFYDIEKKMILLLGLCYRRSAPPSSVSANEVHDASVHSLRDQLQMQLLMYSSSHVLFIVHDHARVSTSQTQTFRSLSNAKHQLLHLLKQKPSSKHASKASSILSSSHFAPGRCVPLATFVFPVDGGRKLSRSQTTTFCKAIETRLHAILKPLRGGTIATVRAKDSVAANNTNKERRLFVLDPTHEVMAVPRKLATDDCCLLGRMAAVLNSIDIAASAPAMDLKHVLKPLDDEDSIAMPHAIQFASKCIDLFAHDGTSFACFTSGNLTFRRFVTQN
ncbi:hypothetical protein DYB32_007013 [Aphanomyces invadans]|uniref:Nonsense-mediated mRNA decay factor SMG8 n=1 Tax=Aphanomyces invadans TaxID=157072 RepID=A0A3R6YVS6_9STRA|nr:hypothetical protein DYB32_007013 [Aphanomyces invadans]